MKKRKLGDKINRGFVIIILILGGIMMVRFGIKVIIDTIKPQPQQEYPETQDDFGETAHGLDVPRELIDSTVDAAYVDGFFIQ